MKRRDLIKYLSVAPIVGGIVGSGIPFLSDAAVIAPLKRDLIKELGLRTFINAAGTYTTHTASLMDPEVMEAINSSSSQFVMISEVQDKVGEKIAELCHAEAAMVTAGCWSALVLGTAGILTGTDLKKIGQLPNVEGFEKMEMIVQKGHNYDYVHAPTNAGAKVIVIETKEELENAITEKTALMYYLNVATDLGQIKHEEWVAIAKKHQVPTMIDIAADIPPVQNLWKYNDLGFDLVCVSGGKAICGPQSAGILMGRKELIKAARLNAPPHGDNIGRGMKVNKEEILGMYAALDHYIKRDHKKEWQDWEERVALIGDEAKKVNGVTTTVTVPPIANHTPLLNIAWDISKIKITSQELQLALRNGSPSIETMQFSPNSINITVFMLRPGEEKIVAKRVHEELNKVG
ncbi:aminotransferase class V-fold PLP-dependent enzyme [Pedobacter sp. L105]|uniref:aminotransferase class V-fold PLP-dependent enzyme n=1 Tax=Pedobacter sp. L105 TaxID=1641871 RepID=UPI001C20458E|nr:aminotransferase class V-fold PLP-dependent enzyme [Pedobacter sp. L105]